MLTATTHTESRQEGIRKGLRALDVLDKLEELWESGLFIHVIVGPAFFARFAHSRGKQVSRAKFVWEISMKTSLFIAKNTLNM